MSFWGTMNKIGKGVSDFGKKAVDVYTAPIRAGGEFLFGTESAKKAAKAEAEAAKTMQTVKQRGAGFTDESKAAGKQYEKGYSQSMGTSAQDFMKKSEAAAGQQAGRIAQAATTQATQASLRGARTAGVNPAQAAMLAGRQAANVYGNTYQQGLQTGMDRYGQATSMFGGAASDYANRRLQGMNIEQGAAAGQAGIAAGQAAAAQQKQNATLGAIGNIAGVALMASDEDVKKNIETTDPYTIIDENLKKYKGNVKNDMILQRAMEDPTDANLMAVEDAGLLDKYLKLMGVDKDEEAPAYGTDKIKRAINDPTDANLDALDENELQEYLKQTNTPYNPEAPNYGSKRKTTSLLDDVSSKVRPVKYDYKNEPDGTGHVGVIAQDLEKTPLKNAVKDVGGTKMINTTELTPGILNLVVELANRVKTLEGDRNNV